MIRFSVPGKPQGKGRHRVAMRGGKVRTYTPEQTVAYEGIIGFYGREAMGDHALIEGPVYLHITAIFARPKRLAKATGTLWHTAKPDGDNIAKAVGDGLNGIIWRDDSQVALTKVTKIYGDVPGLEVMVEALP